MRWIAVVAAGGQGAGASLRRPIVAVRRGRQGKVITTSGGLTSWQCMMEESHGALVRRGTAARLVCTAEEATAHGVVSREERGGLVAAATGESRRASAAMGFKGVVARV